MSESDAIRNQLNHGLTSFDDGGEFVCQCCGEKYVKKSGDWNFHKLCDACFGKFDRAKMAGRFGNGPPTEDSATWALANKPEYRS